MKKIITKVLCVCLVITCLFSMNSFAVSGTVNESESNNTSSTADRTYNDYNSYGTISSTSDVDWWTIDITEDGVANFWIGNVPSGCNYRFQVYSSNGTTLLATSNSVYNSQALVKLQVSHGTYKIKIYSASGCSSSSKYLFRVKNYTLPPLYVGDLLWNIESIYYYLASSATIYSNEIAVAANNWVNTGYGWNNLYPNTRTTNVNISAMDISVKSDTGGALARAVFYLRTNGTSGEPYWVYPEDTSTDWLFCEIWLNQSSFAGLNAEDRQAIIAHEMGHVFGLGENTPNPKSIMYDSFNTLEVRTVQEVDHIAFNQKHP